MLVSSFSGKVDFLDKNTHRISYAETDTEGVNNGGSNSNSDKKNEVATEGEKISDPSKQDGYEKDLDNKEGRDLITKATLELSANAKEGAEKVAKSLKEIMQNPRNATNEAKSYLIALKNHANQHEIAKYLADKLNNNGFVTKLTTDESFRKLLSELLPSGVFNNLSSLADSSSLSGGAGKMESKIAGTVGLSDTAFPHTMSDLLASVIFSINEKDGKADGARISFSDLERYPANSDKLQVYGRLQAPKKTTEDGSTPAGRQLVSYLHTIYGFDYLVPIPKSSSEAKTFSGFLYCLFNEGKEAAGETIFSKMLTAAKWGASLYDLCTGAINALSGLLPVFNIFSLLGLTNEKSPVTLFTMLYDVIANTLGLGSGWVQALVKLSIVLMTSFLILNIMVSLARSIRDRNSIFNKIKIWLIRIIVILFLVPSAVVVQGAIDEFTNSIVNDKDIISSFNNKYVLDSLTWAATMNLSLAPINSSNIATRDGANDDESAFNRRNWAFAPTPENIGKLNSEIEARAKAAGLTSDDLFVTDSKGEKKAIVRHQATSAANLFEKLSSKETVNVNDYLAMVRRAGNSERHIAASNTPIGHNFSLGSGFSKKLYGVGGNTTVINPFFFEKREGQDSSNNQNAESTSTDDSSAKYTFKIGSKEFKVNQDSPIKPTYVSWHNLSYYIYGANSVSSISKEQSIFYNFIDGNGTKQNINPEDGNTPSDEKVKEALNLNAASIALMNRYAGIITINGGQTPSLSTQSTVFLLQSHSAGGNLDYSGVNTSPSDSGKTKNSGVTGNKFVRYVIPNSGKLDVMYKIGLLSVTWISAGFTSIFVLLYLFRCGFLGIFWKMFKNFLVAQTTGNVISAMAFFVYYMAFKLTFVFAKLGLNLGTWVISLFLNLNPAYSTILAGESFTKGLVDSIPLVGKATRLLPPLSILAIAPIICLILTWPTHTIKLGSNNTPRRVSFLELIVNGGYLLAEASKEYLDTFHRRIYGKSRSQTFGAKLKSQAQGIDQKELLKSKGSQLAKVGMAVATGGTSAVGAMGSLKGRAALAGSNVGNAVSSAVDTTIDNFKENGVLGGVTATFNDAKNKASDIITGGKTNNANIDENGVEMPERTDLKAFFNAKKNMNNRTNTKGDDPLHYAYSKDINNAEDEEQSINSAIKQDVKQDVTQDIKQDVKNANIDSVENGNNKVDIKSETLDAKGKDINLNVASISTDGKDKTTKDEFDKKNAEFSKKVSNLKDIKADKVDGLNVTNGKIVSDNLEMPDRIKDENLSENLNKILNKKDKDFAKRAEYGMDNAAHKMAEKLSKSYTEAIPELKNLLGKKEALTENLNNLKVKIDEGSATELDKRNYNKYQNDMLDVNKQIKSFENAFDKTDAANKFYTNLGNKINEIQDSRAGKYFSSVSKMVRDNLQSDGKGDRAEKYLEKLATAENKKANAPYAAKSSSDKSINFKENPVKTDSTEELNKLIKEMLKQNQEQHEEMMKATTENTNVLDQLGINNKESI